MATTLNAAAPTFVVMPGDLVLFLDTRLPVAAGNETNQVAVVVDEQGALYIGKGIIGRRIRRIPLQQLPSLANVQFRRTKHAGYGNLIARYFLKCADQPSYFEAGLRALHCDNHQPFETGRLFPERPIYRSDDEYEAAWTRFKSLLKPFDGIYTVDQSSRISRFIAWATHGTWSHVALYIGDGEIHESVTSGIREVPLEIYKGRQYWVAAYRHIGAITNPHSVEEARATARSLPFHRDRYSYRGAIKFGLRAFFNDHSPDLVPNSAMYGGNRIFIAQVLFSGRAVVKRLGIEGKMQTRISERPMPTQKKPKRTERLQFFVSTDELSAIDEFRFENRMPSRAATVREIFRRALSAAEKEERSRRH